LERKTTGLADSRGGGFPQLAEGTWFGHAVARAWRCRRELENAADIFCGNVPCLYFAKGILIPLAVASLLAVIPLTDNSVITDLGRLSSSASGQRHYPSWLWFVSERRP
jgi:hypothetical protein